MAEKTPQAAAAATEAEAPGKKKGLPLKTMAIMLIALVLEGVAISAAFVIAGKPADVKADKIAATEATDSDKPVEKLVIADKFQNNRSGKTYLYDTEIWVVVQKKDEKQVEKRLEAMEAQTSADIATIFRRAEPAQLLEPTLATLTRQIKAVLDERLGKDAQGGSMIQEVLMKKYTQYRVDAY